MIDLFQSLGAAAPLARGLFLTFGAVVWTIMLVRLVGLRSFSKMTNFDFVTTIATGSLIAQAGTRSEWTDYFQAMAAIAGVFLVQWSLAAARQRSDKFRRLLKNQPVLLMEHGRFLEKAMKETRVSRSNILEKLRASNVSNLEDVRAVVLETTGDISVLTGAKVECQILEGVKI